MKGGAGGKREEAERGKKERHGDRKNVYWVPTPSNSLLVGKRLELLQLNNLYLYCVLNLYLWRGTLLHFRNLLPNSLYFAFRFYGDPSLFPISSVTTPLKLRRPVGWYRLINNHCVFQQTIPPVRSQMETWQHDLQ